MWRHLSNELALCQYTAFDYTDRGLALCKKISIRSPAIHRASPVYSLVLRLPTYSDVKMPAYCCICRRTPADYNSLYRFPQNPERLAVSEEKLSAVKI